jgi:hypothetical protein
MNIEDAYRLLVTLMLKGPRIEEKEKNRTFFKVANILESFGLNVYESPVNGISIGIDRNRELSLFIFLEYQAEGLAEYLSESLHLKEFRLQQLVIGKTRTTSRPAEGGDSLGQGVPFGNSGTFGCLVEDAAGDERLLSCAHVLSDINSGNIGLDEVWQPSAKAGGSYADRIGVLADYAPIQIGGVVPNMIDAALADPYQTGDVIDGIKTLGAINGTATSIPYRQSVQKYGWKTKKTDGRIIFRTSFLQNYPGIGDALFVDQLGIVGSTGYFSDDGDSGSLVLNDRNEAVGLIFADSPDTGITFANPISEVFNYFGVIPR